MLLPLMKVEYKKNMVVRNSRNSNLPKFAEKILVDSPVKYSIIQRVDTRLATIKKVRRAITLIAAIFFEVASGSNHSYSLKKSIFKNMLLTINFYQKPPPIKQFIKACLQK